MISRTLLSNTIAKYRLGGLVEKVIWKVKDKQLHVAFRNEAGNLTGELFVPCDIEDGEYNIYDTSKLNKLLDILEGNLLITVEKNQSQIPSKLTMADTKIDINYNLAAPEILKGYWFDSSIVKDKLPAFDVTAELSNDDIRVFLKAVNALGSEIVDFQLSNFDGLNGDEVMFSLGSKTSNKVKFNVLCEKTNELTNNFKYDIPSFKEIFNANKNADKSQLYISNNGVIKAVFTETIYEQSSIECGTIQITYYIANTGELK